MDNTPHINYITNPDAETDTTGWATYADAAGNIPVDATGGSATNLTFSRTTSTPLRGTASFSMVQANSTSLQGKGVSYDFTIDTADKAKVLAISFDYNASSTFVASNGITAPLNDGTVTTNAGNSDIEIFIYDVTNSVLIPVSPQVMTANGTNNFQFKGIFQTASNSTSYRLAFHIATANANATGWTYKFDNLFVGPQSVSFGSPVSDWVAYTPTWASTGTAVAIGNGTQTGFWRRVGDSMEVQIRVTSGTSTTYGTGNYRFSLPTGYTIDSTKVTGAIDNNTAFGVGLAIDSAGVRYVGLARSRSGDSSNVVIQEDLDAGTGNIFGQTIPYTPTASTAAQIWDLHFTVPITGWSSSVLMSNESDSRVVSFAAANIVSTAATGTITGSDSIMIFGSTLVAHDTHAGYNSTSGVYTVQVAGYYKCSAGVQINGTFAAGNNGQVSIQKNGTTIATQGYQAGSSSQTRLTPVVSIVRSFVAGDTIQPAVNCAATSPVYTSSVAGQAYFTVERISGPASLATTDAVSMRYFSSSTSVSGSLANITYATKDFDSHNTYSSGTYTIPVAGKYQVNAAILLTATTTAANNLIQLQINKNGSAYSGPNDNYFASATAKPLSLEISDLVNCIAGDTITVQASNAGSTPSISASNSANYISIVRVGN